MPSPEKLLAAAQLADTFGDALGECASFLAAIPGDGPVKVKVTESLRTASGLAKAAPGAAFKAAKLASDASDAYQASGTKRFVDAMKKHGVIASVPPAAHRTGKGGAK